MIIIADNQPLTRDALRLYLKEQSCVEAVDKQSLVGMLNAHADAVVILDFSLFDFTAPENLLIFFRRFPGAHWILLSAEFSDGLLRLFSAEPNAGFLTKDCTREDVLHAVYLATKGERVVCPSVKAQLDLPHAEVRPDHLTHTEREVLSLIAQGKSAKQIAEERHSSVHTIITHKKNIFRKLGVSTAYEATRYALRSGIVEPVEYYI